jgi:hypothetical protein
MLYTYIYTCIIYTHIQTYMERERARLFVVEGDARHIVGVFRMCSLTIECVLSLQNVFSYLFVVEGDARHIVGVGRVGREVLVQRQAELA